MGWIGQRNWYKPSDVRKDIERTWNESENWKIDKISSKAFGRRVWLLIENKQTSKREIILYLVDKMAYNSYGYKDVSEDMGPTYYDCPISFLEDAGPAQSDYAAQWREKVRKFHKKRSAKFHVGDRVKIYKYEYVVTAILKRNAYLVQRLDNGREYKAMARQMYFANGLEEARSMARAK